jgi:uncharacterized coiled-coil protein SlyX
MATVSEALPHICKQFRDKKHYANFTTYAQLCGFSNKDKNILDFFNLPITNRTTFLDFEKPGCTWHSSRTRLNVLSYFKTALNTPFVKGLLPAPRFQEIENAITECRRQVNENVKASAPVQTTAHVPAAATVPVSALAAATVPPAQADSSAKPADSSAKQTCGCAERNDSDFDPMESDGEPATDEDDDISIEPAHDEELAVYRNTVTSLSNALAEGNKQIGFHIQQQKDYKFRIQGLEATIKQQQQLITNYESVIAEHEKTIVHYKNAHRTITQTLNAIGHSC